MHRLKHSPAQSVCRETKADAPGVWRKVAPPVPETTKQPTDAAGEDDGFSAVKSRSTVKRASKQSAPVSKNGASPPAKKDSWGPRGDRVGDRDDRTGRTATVKKGGAW